MEREGVEVALWVVFEEEADDVVVGGGGGDESAGRRDDVWMMWEGEEGMELGETGARGGAFGDV